MKNKFQKDIISIELEQFQCEVSFIDEIIWIMEMIYYP